MESENTQYSALIRYIYLAMGVILLLSTAFLKYELPFPSIFPFIIILALIISAGLTTPGLKMVMISDFFVALITFIIFGWQVFVSYNTPGMVFFWTSLMLSLLAMCALYFSTRTLRYNLFKYNV